jgi:hypothetical protein
MMTDISTLEPIARALLAKHGAPARALPHLRRLLMKRSDLLDALALAYLDALAQNPHPGESPDAAAGQPEIEVQLIHAGGGPLSPDPDPGDAGPVAAGQSVFDAQRTRAGGDDLPAETRKWLASPGGRDRPKPIHVHAHRRARKRSEGERQAAIVAVARTMSTVFDRPILGKPIGQYRWRELPELRRTLTKDTARHIRTEAATAKDAVLIDKLLCHIVAEADDRVCDVVSDRAFLELEVAAERDAPIKLDVSEDAAHIAFVQQLEYRAGS